MRAFIAILLATMPAQAVVAGGLESLAADGWYTWQFEAIDDAPAWCCFSWNSGTPGQAGCTLDAGDAGYGNCNDLHAGTAAMRIYTRIESGRPVKLMALSFGCPVNAEAAVTDLGAVATSESFAWLRQALADSRVSEYALAAIAVHRGEAPLRFLRDTAKAGSDDGIRENAIFWLGQVRISEASDDIERLMFADPDPAIRQHAAFSLAESTAANRADALIRQGRRDADAEVRSQAWFWLAQTGAPASEQAIMQAIDDDQDSGVREEAVFALSQLPGDRGVDALFSILRDRHMGRELREQALFWLVQSESDRAFAFVERLLADAP